MHPVEIRNRLRAVPFVPFRVFLSDGSRHDVPHPEFAFVGRNLFLIVVDVDTNGIPRKTVHSDPIHVTRIEPIPAAS